MSIAVNDRRRRRFSTVTSIVGAVIVAVLIVWLLVPRADEVQKAGSAATARADSWLVDSGEWIDATFASESVIAVGDEAPRSAQTFTRDTTQLLLLSTYEANGTFESFRIHDGSDYVTIPAAGPTIVVPINDEGLRVWPKSTSSDLLVVRAVTQVLQSSPNGVGGYQSGGFRAAAHRVEITTWWASAIVTIYDGANVTSTKIQPDTPTFFDTKPSQIITVSCNECRWSADEG